MLSLKKINIKNFLLLASTVLFSYFEIIYFDIDHFLLIEDDFKRFGFYTKFQSINLIFSYFPFIYLIVLLIYQNLDKLISNKFYIFIVLLVSKILFSEKEFTQLLKFT